LKEKILEVIKKGDEHNDKDNELIKKVMGAVKNEPIVPEVVEPEQEHSLKNDALKIADEYSAKYDPAEKQVAEALKVKKEEEALVKKAKNESEAGSANLIDNKVNTEWYKVHQLGMKKKQPKAAAKATKSLNKLPVAAPKKAIVPKVAAVEQKL